MSNYSEVLLPRGTATREATVARPRKLDQIREAGGTPIPLAEIVDIEAVRVARRHLPERQVIAAASALFGALGDPTRLRIIATLAVQELCVGDVAATIGLSPSAVSHQLRVLRELGVVRARRDGRLIYYALDDDHVSRLFSEALEHVRHS